MPNPRKTALNALIRVNQDAGYSNIVIDAALRDSELDLRDKNFASALFYGVLERKLTLDYIISKYSKTAVSKLSPVVLEALRLALYQIFYMDKIPESAAVDQSVRLVKSSKDGRFSGFVNGVLRSVLRDGTERALSCDGNKTKKMSVQYSVPEWLVHHLAASYGDQLAEGFLSASFGRPPVSVRVNTTRISCDQLKGLLESRNIRVNKSRGCENLLELSGAGAVEELLEYQEGLFHAQDAASALCCQALAPRPGERILDVCAAPGGKSFTVAEIMQNKGEVVSLDLYDHKVKLIKNGAKRLGLNCIKPMQNDAKSLNQELGIFDRVLCDLPCSGLGTVSYTHLQDRVGRGMEPGREPGSDADPKRACSFFVSRRRRVQKSRRFKRRRKSAGGHTKNDAFRSEFSFAGRAYEPSGYRFT